MDEKTVFVAENEILPAPSKNGVMWGPLGKEVFLRTYSRMKPDGTSESWRDTVERVVDGNLGLVSDRFHEPGERDKLFRLMYGMGVIPGGRHLWATGVPGRQYLSNCHSAGHSRKELTEHFTFTFEELLKGGGVGSNYSNKYIELYPPIFSPIDLHIVSNPAHPDIQAVMPYLSKTYTYSSRNRHVIEDSREGWSAALAEVLRAAWHGRETPLILDISMLREKGAVLRSFGGKSSGPAPLVEMLVNVTTLLNRKVGHKLSSLDMMEIDHEISRVVVAGGIRRSARMSVKYWGDRDILDFVHSKKKREDGDSPHWTTNISVEVDEEFFRALRKKTKHATTVLHEVAIAMHRDGEPGFWNSALAAVGEVDYPFTPNPCGEIAMPPWDVCCLGHVNLDKFAGKDAEAEEAFRLMTRFLIRATFGDIMNPLQREVIHRNRRIGVGFFGYANWLAFQGIRFSESHHHAEVRRRLRSFRDACQKEALRYACQLRIPVPIKTTAIAPTGSISNLPGVTSGCQPIFARYFRRRIRYAENDQNLAGLIAKQHPIEESENEPQTKIVSFFCKDPLVAECERKEIELGIVEEQQEISLSDHLAVQSMLQQEFADNCISYTINFDPKKILVDEIERVLTMHLPHLKGTTLMPEATREQMPFERITREEYEEMAARGLAMVRDADRECKDGSCPIK